jgi:NAD(P)-dependent dehydrogenase (short-subunit alcohol dehydrogenase family)
MAVKKSVSPAGRVGTSDDRVAVITGAAGGIGAACVALFRQERWKVVAVDRAEGGPDADLRLRADVAVLDDLDRVFAEVQGAYGRLDALVNNAAEQICKPASDTMPNEWDRVMHVNVRAAYLAAVRALPLLRRGGGSVVNVASIHALATSPGMSAYAASKGALVSLTRSLALELASDGIRVNAVLPGATDTPMLRAGLTREGVFGDSSSAAALLAKRHPLGRIGRPDEIARAVYFMSDSTWSSFVTGATLLVDGGAYAQLSTE